MSVWEAAFCGSAGLDFNSGAAVGATALTALALANTGIASCTAGLVWILLDRMVHGKMTTLGLMTGFVAGLVGITPAAGFVTVGSAFLIGITTPVICFFFVSYVKGRLGYDDSLDAFGCHGVGGVWGRTHDWWCWRRRASMMQELTDGSMAMPRR